MATSTTTLNTTAYAMSGGVDAVAPRGPTYRITFTGTWAPGDTWLFSIVSTVGDLTLGFGNITLDTSINGYVHNQRVYIANGNEFDFSENGDATGWEQQNSGAGSIPFTTKYGAADTVQAFADYQGKLAVYGRRSVLIWTPNADPTQFALFQTLTNIGTFAPFSVQSLGELDVLFLSDTGIRSLRARETTLNAFVNDLGSPVDIPVQAAIAPLNSTERATCCAVVEPTQNRYWLAIPADNPNTDPSTIFVLSYFAQNKILAWSTYTTDYEQEASIVTNSSHYFLTDGSAIYNVQAIIGATYTWTKGANDISVTCGSTTRTTSGTFVATSTSITGIGTPNALVTATLVGPVAATFVPQKFVVANGQVFVRTATTVLSFGGSAQSTYDGTVATIQVPFMDIKKPGHLKASAGIDVDIDGSWTISATPDWIGGTMIPIIDPASAPTFDGGWIPFNASGTHFSLQAESTGRTAAKVSSMILYYKEGATPCE